MEEGYRISNIYQGGYSSLDPGKSMYGLKGNTNVEYGTMPAGKLGLAGDFRTANVIQDVSLKLASGAKNIEISPIQPEVFDSIPKQQLKELNRLAKLTGIDVTIHAPLVEASGMTQQGFSEAEREAAERKIVHALLRSHELNPQGNSPVTFHSSQGLPGSQLLPPSQQKEGERYKQLIAVNRETGRPIPIVSETMYFPGEKDVSKGEYRSPDKRIESINLTEWTNQIDPLFFNQERARELIEKTRPFVEPFADEDGKIRFKMKDLPSEKQQEIAMQFNSIKTYLEDLHLNANNLFSKAYRFGSDEQKNQLIRLNEEFKKDLKESSEKDIFGEATAMQKLISTLKSPEFTPQMYVPIEKFATEKSGESFGNAAWKTYKELKGKNLPIISIENPPAGAALSTGEDIRNIVIKSREQFIKNATQEGMSESQARDEAEKIIGATWDVGHINMLRGQGYSEKEVIAESEKVAPFLKHVHLSDNFGFEHTELPMGMGNVPLKEIMEKLGEKGFEARKIIEAGNWWQHFKTSPFQETLEAMGSPIYGMKMAPYWSQAPGLVQGYFGGYGQMLPQINYETFGTGFSRLPAELGGQSPGAQGSRMSGRGME